MIEFATNYAEILTQIENIDPIGYSRSRNFLNGKVTMLSPYLTHGVISLKHIKESILKKYKYSQVEKLIFELAWKEYFLRVWENKKDEIWTDLKRPQESQNNSMSQNIVEANTGIQAINEQITQLYEFGYMHNHARMWTASLVTNIAKSHWLSPARWMYYHLLDGDLASNTLSWQWVAGTFSSKKYFANQENINKYANTRQFGTYLDTSYEDFDTIQIPTELAELQDLDLKTNLAEWVLDSPREGWQTQSEGVLLAQQNSNFDPKSTTIENKTSTTKSLILFHPWMLDPNFGLEISNCEKILVLEPSHFNKYPMSRKRIKFILDLAKNISNLKVFVGEVVEFGLENYDTIITKKYPAIEHWNNIKNIEIVEPEYMFPTVSGYFGSFMGYWKMCEKAMKQ